MDFEITVSERKTYIYIRPRKNITTDLAIAFTKEALEIGEKNNIRKRLLDLRGLSSASGILGKWEFANKEVKKLGLPRNWKLATLHDEGDSEVPFIETAMRNAGYDYRVFTREEEAVAWLEED